MTPEAEKALEEKAREILRKLFPCDFTSVPDYDRDRAWLVDRLREIADQARQESGAEIARLKAELELDHEAHREQGRHEEAAEIAKLATDLVEELAQDAGHSPDDMLAWNRKSHGAIWLRDEILRRRGGKP